jgi:hypothetical protein
MNSGLATINKDKQSIISNLQDGNYSDLINKFSNVS